MKNKIFTTFIASFLILTLSIPIYAHSSDWEFTMNRRYVSGKSNGEYHNFDEDSNITIDGNLTYNSTSWQVAETDPLNITVVLYRDKVGRDKKIGSYRISSPDAEGDDVPTLSKSFTKKLGTSDEDSDDYYLVFSKVEDDNWNITGAGDLSD